MQCRNASKWILNYFNAKELIHICKVRGISTSGYNKKSLSKLAAAAEKIVLQKMANFNYRERVRADRRHRSIVLPNSFTAKSAINNLSTHLSDIWTYGIFNSLIYHWTNCKADKQGCLASTRKLAAENYRRGGSLRCLCSKPYKRWKMKALVSLNKESSHQKLLIEISMWLKSLWR